MMNKHIDFAVLSGEIVRNVCKAAIVETDLLFYPCL
jgi:hypothetical protein